MRIKDIVSGLIKKYKTNDPFRIAAKRHIHILYEPLGSTMGYFSRDFRIGFIHINQYLPGEEKIFVCGHELGHGVMHQDINTPFLKRHTLFSTSKIERQANTFAVELLLPDSLLREYSDCSIINIAKNQGVPEKLIQLKFFTL